MLATSYSQNVVIDAVLNNDDDDEIAKSANRNEESKQEEWLQTAKESLKFFLGKMVKIGNRFLKVGNLDLVVNEKSLKILANSTDFNIAMRTANNAVNRLVIDNSVVLEGYRIRVSNYKETVLLNCWLMHEMRKYSISKEFKGGIILLYLWLCLGVTFIDEDFLDDPSKEEQADIEEVVDEEEEDSDQEV
jgi:hypothetical protein